MNRRFVPGFSLSPDDAIAKVADAVEGGADVRHILVQGPGEALLSAATYVVLRRLAWRFPGLPLTVCTNGLLLSDRLDELVRTGVKSIVLSINAITPQTAMCVYESASYRTRRYNGEAAASLVLQLQWHGLRNAVESGLTVTVSIARLAGVNEQEIALIEERAKDLGADDVIACAPVQHLLT